MLFLSFICVCSVLSITSARPTKEALTKEDNAMTTIGKDPLKNLALQHSLASNNGVFMANQFPSLTTLPEEVTIKSMHQTYKASQDKDPVMALKTTKNWFNFDNYSPSKMKTSLNTKSNLKTTFRFDQAVTDESILNTAQIEGLLDIVKRRTFKSPLYFNPMYIQTTDKATSNRFMDGMQYSISVDSESYPNYQELTTSPKFTRNLVKKGSRALNDRSKRKFNPEAEMSLVRDENAQVANIEDVEYKVDSSEGDGPKSETPNDIFDIGSRNVLEEGEITKSKEGQPSMHNGQLTQLILSPATASTYEDNANFITTLAAILTKRQQEINDYDPTNFFSYSNNYLKETSQTSSTTRKPSVFNFFHKFIEMRDDTTTDILFTFTTENPTESPMIRIKRKNSEKNLAALSSATTSKPSKGNGCASICIQPKKKKKHSKKSKKRSFLRKFDLHRKKNKDKKKQRRQVDPYYGVNFADTMLQNPQVFLDNGNIQGYKIPAINDLKAQIPKIFDEQNNMNLANIGTTDTNWPPTFPAAPNYNPQDKNNLSGGNPNDPPPNPLDQPLPGSSDADPSNPLDPLNPPPGKPQPNDNPLSQFDSSQFDNDETDTQSDTSKQNQIPQFDSAQNQIPHLDQSNRNSFPHYDLPSQNSIPTELSPMKKPFEKLRQPNFKHHIQMASSLAKPNKITQVAISTQALTSSKKKMKSRPSVKVTDIPPPQKTEATTVSTKARSKSFFSMKTHKPSSTLRSWIFDHSINLNRNISRSKSQFYGGPTKITTEMSQTEDISPHKDTDNEGITFTFSTINPYQNWLTKSQLPEVVIKRNLHKSNHQIESDNVRKYNRKSMLKNFDSASNFNEYGEHVYSQKKNNRRYMSDEALGRTIKHISSHEKTPKCKQPKDKTKHKSNLKNKSEHLDNIHLDSDNKRKVESIYGQLSHNPFFDRKSVTLYTVTPIVEDFYNISNDSAPTDSKAKNAKNKKAKEKAKGKSWTYDLSKDMVMKVTVVPQNSTGNPISNETLNDLEDKSRSECNYTLTSLKQPKDTNLEMVEKKKKTPTKVQISKHVYKFDIVYSNLKNGRESNDQFTPNEIASKNDLLNSLRNPFIENDQSMLRRRETRSERFTEKDDSKKCRSGDDGKFSKTAKAARNSWDKDRRVRHSRYSTFLSPMMRNIDDTELGNSPQTTALVNTGPRRRVRTQEDFSELVIPQPDLGYNLVFTSTPAIRKQYSDSKCTENSRFKRKLEVLPEGFTHSATEREFDTNLDSIDFISRILMARTPKLLHNSEFLFFQNKLPSPKIHALPNSKDKKIQNLIVKRNADKKGSDSNSTSKIKAVTKKGETASPKKQEMSTTSSNSNLQSTTLTKLQSTTLLNTSLKAEPTIATETTLKLNNSMKENAITDSVNSTKGTASFTTTTAKEKGLFSILKHLSPGKKAKKKSIYTHKIVLEVQTTTTPSPKKTLNTKASPNYKVIIPTSQILTRWARSRDPIHICNGFYLIEENDGKITLSPITNVNYNQKQTVTPLKVNLRQNVVISRAFLDSIQDKLNQIYDSLANQPHLMIHVVNVTNTNVPNVIHRFRRNSPLCQQSTGCYKCKANHKMCNVCAATEAVVTELVFEFSNLAKFIDKHCKDIERFFVLNPSGARKFQESVHKVDQLIDSFYLKAKTGKNNNCNTMRMCINKRSVSSFATILDKCTKKPDVQLPRLRLERVAHNGKSKKVVKNMYYLDNISVNIICDPASVTTPMNNDELATLDLLINPHDIEKQECTKKKKTCVCKLLRSLINKYNLKTETKSKSSRKTVKRNIGILDPVEPIITDTGGDFWVQYLNKECNEKVTKDYTRQLRSPQGIQGHGLIIEPRKVLDTVTYPMNYNKLLGNAYKQNTDIWTPHKFRNKLYTDEEKDRPENYTIILQKLPKTKNRNPYLEHHKILNPCSQLFPPDYCLSGTEVQKLTNNSCHFIHEVGTLEDKMNFLINRIRELSNDINISNISADSVSSKEKLLKSSEKLKKLIHDMNRIHNVKPECHEDSRNKVLYDDFNGQTIYVTNHPLNTLSALKKSKDENSAFVTLASNMVTSAQTLENKILTKGFSYVSKKPKATTETKITNSLITSKISPKVSYSKYFSTAGSDMRSRFLGFVSPSKKSFKSTKKFNKIKDTNVNTMRPKFNQNKNLKNFHATISTAVNNKKSLFSNFQEASINLFVTTNSLNGRNKGSNKNIFITTDKFKQISYTNISSNLRTTKNRILNNINKHTTLGITVGKKEKISKGSTDLFVTITERNKLMESFASTRNILKSTVKRKSTTKFAPKLSTQKSCIEDSTVVFNKQAVTSGTTSNMAITLLKKIPEVNELFITTNKLANHNPSESILPTENILKSTATFKSIENLNINTMNKIRLYAATHKKKLCDILNKQSTTVSIASYPISMRVTKIPKHESSAVTLAREMLITAQILQNKSFTKLSNYIANKQKTSTLPESSNSLANNNKNKNDLTTIKKSSFENLNYNTNTQSKLLQNKQSTESIKSTVTYSHTPLSSKHLLPSASPVNELKIVTIIAEGGIDKNKLLIKLLEEKNRQEYYRDNKAIDEMLHKIQNYKDKSNSVASNANPIIIITDDESNDNQDINYNDDENVDEVQTSNIIETKPIKYKMATKKMKNSMFSSRPPRFTPTEEKLLTHSESTKMVMTKSNERREHNSEMVVTKTVENTPNNNMTFLDDVSIKKAPEDRRKEDLKTKTEFSFLELFKRTKANSKRKDNMIS